MAPLLENARGDKLLRLLTMPEEQVGQGFHVTHSLVLVRANDGFLLVHNRQKGYWELPGGMVDEGESPRECAEREVLEESGQCLRDMRFRGLMEFELQPSRWNPDVHIEFGALYCAETDADRPFVPNGEIDRIGYWNPSNMPAETEAVDSGLLGYYLCPDGNPIP